MVEEDFFIDYRIAIIGLGLMGGSLALRLRNRCRGLTAVDPDLSTRDFAIQNHIVEAISEELADILPGADAIVLAAPVTSILEIIPQLPNLHPGSPVIIDLGSTKSKICQVLNNLPPRFEPIGGHPMCGKEVGGLSHADPDLFQSAQFALTALPRTTNRARSFAEQLVISLGSVPVWVEPDTHDEWVAATSHIPYLLAAALILATPTEASQLVGPGFKSVSRLASSPSSVMIPVLQTNRDLIIEALNRLRKELDSVGDLLTRNDFTALKAILEEGAERKDELTYDQ